MKKFDELKALAEKQAGRFDLFIGGSPENLLALLADPKHLRVVTFYENVMFGNSPSAINKRKSHCNNGHLLSGKNIYFRVSGKNRDRKSRVCRACENNAKRIKRAALRALKV